MEVDEEKETEIKKDRSDTKMALSAEDSVNDVTKLYDGVKQKSFKWLVEWNVFVESDEFMQFIYAFTLFICKICWTFTIKVLSWVSNLLPSIYIYP